MIEIKEKKPVVETFVKLKDFKPGDKAFLVSKGFGSNNGLQILEREVQVVGRKYVTVYRDEKYFEDSYRKCNYLTEKAHYGEVRRLFKTKEAAEDYIEKCKLTVWLANVNYSRAEKLSLEQLRSIHKIVGD